MFLGFILLVVSSLFLLVSPFYYSIILLVFSTGLMTTLFAASYVLSLSTFIVLIVYAGAILVLIGYVCAILPNSFISPLPFPLFFISLVTLVALSTTFIEEGKSDLSSSSPFPLVEVFYTSEGCWTLSFLVFILFTTVLSVTTSLFSPSGPFRAI